MLGRVAFLVVGESVESLEQSFLFSEAEAVIDAYLRLNVLYCLTPTTRSSNAVAAETRADIDAFPLVIIFASVLMADFV